jgi:hypothetical protein
VTCKNVLWIDAVGLYYIAEKLKAEKREINALYGPLIWCIYKYKEHQRHLGILLDGNARERKCIRFNGVDAKYAKALHPIMDARLHVEYVWYVSRDSCDYACMRRHELYSALCKCSRDDWFIVAECGCNSLEEGAIGSKLQGSRYCGRCLLLVACPAAPTAPR